MMKIKSASLLAVITAIGVVSLSAQPGLMGGMGSASSPNFGGSMSKLFGDNKSFSADLEIHAKDANTGDTTLSGKLAFDEGKSRFEMDMTKMRNSQMPPQAVEQMKMMGMDVMLAISRPDKNVNYLIYPSLKAYVETPSKESKNSESGKIETTDLGKETVAGHPTVKKKVVVTDEQGGKQEFTVWNATDLKSFPIKLETQQQGMPVTMTFKNVKLEKPDAKQFDVTGEFKKYDNMMSLMQEEMMKRMGGGTGFPPARR